MKDFKYSLIGFFGFVLVTGFNVSIGIVVYSYIEDRSEWLISILIIILILLSAAICSVIDYFRRKIMISRPLQEILDATKLLSRGNFNIRLIPSHGYSYQDEFDLIKEDLNKMAKELSKSELLKNDFIANVSHEIKTPLAVINNYAKLLNDSNLDSDTRKKYLSNLQKTCNKLSNLVSNILKLNKLENQKLLREFKKFNLSDLIISQILQFEEVIDNKEIDLICDIEEDLFINSEPSYLEIVFNNLLSNAIKFTNKNGMIKVSLIKLNDDYIIKFIDSGCGMDKETGAHIFDNFYQGDTSHSKEGNGLGLALVKQVIDILGGKIKVESELGVGTTFIVTIREVR